MTDPEYISILAKDCSWNISHKAHYTTKSPQILEMAAPGFLLLSEGYNHKCFKEFINEQLSREQINQYIELLTMNFNQMCSRLQAGRSISLQTPVFEDLIIESITKHFYDFIFTAEELKLIKSALKRTLGISKHYLNFGNVVTSSFSPLMLGFLREIKRVKSVINTKVEANSRCPLSSEYLRTYLRRFRYLKGDTYSTNSKLVDDVMGLLVAGVDTVNASLAWLITLLSSMPEAVEKIKKESSCLMASNSVRDYRTLSYTRNFVIETLRLYPTFPALYKQVFEELIIDDMRIPAKSWIIIPVFNLHRDSRWFSEPCSFDPGRWEKSHHHFIKANSFIPFGVGMHHCPGSELALAELSVLLSLVVTHFDLLRPENMHQNTSISDLPQIHNGLSISPKFPASILFRKVQDS